MQGLGGTNPQRLHPQEASPFVPLWIVRLFRCVAFLQASYQRVVGSRSKVMQHGYNRKL